MNFEDEDDYNLEWHDESYKIFYEAFNTIKITTITGVCSLNGNVRTTNVFNLLPLEKTELQKGKLIKIGKRGSLISIRGGNVCRGPKKGVQFKNCIMIVMGYNAEKNLTFKLSKSTVHVTGSNSDEMLRDGTQLLVDIVNELQNNLTLIQQNPEQTEDVIDHLQKTCCGDLQQIVDENGDLVYINSILPPRPKGSWGPVEMRIFNFVTLNILEYQYFHEFIEDTQAIASLPCVCDERLEIVDIVTHMNNINYVLGFDVDLVKLSQTIDGCNGFSCVYDSALGDSLAQVILVYERCEKPLKVKVITFMVYARGAVTQSGPNSEKNRWGYYKFIETIHCLRPLIATQGPRTVKVMKNSPAEFTLTDELTRALLYEQERLKEVEESQNEGYY